MRHLAVVLAAVAAFAAPGHAAPVKPQITDPANDRLATTDAGLDVVSALFRTEGTTAKVRGRTVYTPVRLVMTMTYAAEVPATETAAQVVAFDVPGCEDVYLQRYTGGTYGTGDCLDGSFTFTTKAVGKTVTFTVPFTAIGRAYLKPGAVLTSLRTYTAFSEPVWGYESAEIGDPAGVGTIDNATTTGTFKI